MRFTHRALAALIVLALCLIGGANSTPLFAVPAIAEEDAPELRIEFSASPDEFVLPGSSALTFTLTNDTDDLLEAVCLTSVDGLLVEPIGDIEPGAALTYNREHALTQTELDAGSINYIITCVSGSDHFSYPVSTPIQKLAAEPEVEFLRQVSNLYVSDGGSATVIYKIRNVGNVAVSAISVTDALGSFDGRLELLDVGATKTFVQHVSISEDSVSAPILTYSADSESDVYTIQLDELTLHPAYGMLDASITAGRSMFSSDTAEVILQLTNSGNIDYLDITVYDDVYGGVIADSVSVPAGGDPVEVAHSYPIREDSSYRWRVVGHTSAGDPIDFLTNTETVLLDDPTGDPLLTIRATTSMPKISRSGHVPVRLELTNIGGSMAANVRIFEETDGQLFEFAVIPTGDPTVRELRREITEDTTLVFSASYTDSYGQERIATAEPLTITIGPGGQRPETVDHTNSIFGGIAAQMQHSELFVSLLFGSIVLLVVLIIVLLITSRRARIQRRERDSARKQRIKEELAKTNRFKPLRLRHDIKSNTKK